VTFEGANRQASLRIPMVDDRHHTVVVPIGDAVRVAGTAEFAGYDLTTDPGRVRNLVTLARKVLPCAGLDPSGATAWCGLLAMSADGVPIIGATAVSNLFLNTGHGHLGWTLAAGSAKLLADLMSDVAPSVDPAPFSLSRFGEAR
jgi:D-amino-acid dehydrogenase